MKTLSDYITELTAAKEAALREAEEEKEEKGPEGSEDSEEKDSDGDSDEDSDDEKADDAVDMNGFMVLKPEFLDKESDLRNRLKEEGWEIVGEQEKKLSEKEAKAFYDSKKDEPYFDDLVEYMSSGKSKCFMLWKEDSSDPVGELKTLKEKLRQEWSEDDMKNVVHSSDNFDAMEKELSIFLAEPEGDDEEDEKKDDEDADTEGNDIESSDEDTDDEGSDDNDNETEDDDEDGGDSLL